MKCEGENLVFYESPSAKRFCLANESTLLLGQNVQPFFFFLFQRSLHGTSRGLSILCVCVFLLYVSSQWCPSFKTTDSS